MTSRLTQMQARFQQRQVQEKEERLLKLYENQQQRAIERVSRGSAGSNGSLTNYSTGKVRQMFDERRQKAGIDRSYPLEPLNKTTISGLKTNRATSQDRKVGKAPANPRTKNALNGNKPIGKTARTNFGAAAGIINNSNSNVSDEAESYLREHEDLVRLMNTHNMNDSLEDEEMPTTLDDLGYDEDIFVGKLANVGGQLPSQQIALANAKKTTQVTSNNNNNIRNGVAKPPVRKSLTGPRAAVGSGGASSPQRRAQPVRKLASPSTTTTSKPQSPASPPSTSPKHSATTSPSNNTRNDSSSSGNSSKESSPAGSPSKMASKRPAPSNRPISNSRPLTNQGGDLRAPSTARNSGRPVTRPPSVQRDDLAACRFCQRRFAVDRIQTHEDICSRSTKKKRKAYDSTKHRLAGTEVEPFAKKVVKNKPRQSTTKTNWRQKHEEFVAAIRAAKEAQAHIARGGNIRDLPPPPPSSNPDYVQCPHCGRRFNEAAAARHIPKCATYEFNKPKNNRKPTRT